MSWDVRKPVNPVALPENQFPISRSQSPLTSSYSNLPSPSNPVYDTPAAPTVTSKASEIEESTQKEEEEVALDHGMVHDKPEEPKPGNSSVSAGSTGSVSSEDKSKRRSRRRRSRSHSHTNAVPRKIDPVPRLQVSVTGPHDEQETDTWLSGVVETSLAEEAEIAWREAEAAVEAEDAREERLWRKLSVGEDIATDDDSAFCSPRDTSGLSTSGSHSSLTSPSSKQTLPRYRLLHEKLSTPRQKLTAAELHKKHERAEANRLRSEREKMDRLSEKKRLREERQRERDRERREREERLGERGSFS